jgi:hypothetical protein
MTITAATFTPAGTRVFDTATGMRDAEPDDWAAIGDGNHVVFNNEPATVAGIKGFVAGVLFAMFVVAVIACVVAESMVQK